MVHTIKTRTNTLKKSETSLSRVPPVTRVGNWEWDIIRDEVYLSEGACHIFYLIPREGNVTFDKFLSYVHPDDKECIKKSVHEALYGEKACTLDFRITSRDATERFIHAAAEVVFEETGKAIRMIGTVQDITERKRTEEELYLLQTITMAISESVDFDSVLNSVLCKVCKYTKCIYGEVWLISHDSKHLEYRMAWHDNLEELEKLKERSNVLTFLPGSGLPGRVWFMKKPELVLESVVKKNYPHAQFFKEFGFKVAMGIPVITHNEVIAVLTFFVQEQREVDDRLIRLTSSIAAQLGPVIQRKRIEQALYNSEEKLQAILNNAKALISVKDVQGKYTFINKSYEKIFRTKKQEIEGKTDYDIFSKDIAQRVSENDHRVIDAKTSLEFEEIIPAWDGLHTYISVKFPLCDSQGLVNAVCSISTDITGRKQIEELKDQLYHAQRLESIGTLAGGIAHDFNNILAIILGYGNLLQKEIEIEKDNPSMVYVHKILASAERAAKLTKGLLTFSRKQQNNPKPANLNEIIGRIESLLVRIISEDIQLNTVFTDEDCIVMADSNQIEQVLMNLATNAKDAMPNGGFLTIKTEIVELDDGFIKFYGYGEIGKYVLVSVADTGVGMDRETKKRVFEPFFTTKEVGKGTGLGLSIVYGIVKQHRGYINVNSEVGKGTTFKIYIPVVESGVEKIKQEIQITGYDKEAINGEDAIYKFIHNKNTIPSIKGGRETILLAEDEEEVRKLTRIILEKAGYKVIEAINGEDAIHKFIHNTDMIHFLMLDVIMPVKDGKKVYDVIKQMRPDIKVLFISGYSEEFISRKEILKEGLYFITKPISPDELLGKVREVLDK
jgi:PAS domain S-box-containing protein